MGSSRPIIAQIILFSRKYIILFQVLNFCSALKCSLEVKGMRMAYRVTHRYAATDLALLNQQTYFPQCVYAFFQLFLMQHFTWAITHQHEAPSEHPFVSVTGQKSGAWKNFVYLHHHQLWYDLTQLMHNLPIFGVHCEHRTHALTPFKVLQGGDEPTNSSSELCTKQPISSHVSKSINKEGIGSITISLKLNHQEIIISIYIISFHV